MAAITCGRLLGRLDEPVAGRVEHPPPGTPAVPRAAASRSIAARLEGSSRAVRRLSIERTDPPPAEDAADTPACSEAQDARRLGAQGRSVMRSVGLDLGVRHIAYCEVKDGQVVERAAVRSFSQLASRLGPKSAPAVVGFEACREGWHVHDTLKKWGHRPRMLDTTRIRQIGVGQTGSSSGCLRGPCRCQGERSPWCTATAHEQDVLRCAGSRSKKCVYASRAFPG